MSAQAFVDYLNKQPLGVKVAIVANCTKRKMSTVIAEHNLQGFDAAWLSDNELYYFEAFLQKGTLDIFPHKSAMSPGMEKAKTAEIGAWCIEYLLGSSSGPLSNGVAQVCPVKTIPEHVPVPEPVHIPEPVLTVEQVAKLVRSKITYRVLLRHLNRDNGAIKKTFTTFMSTFLTTFTAAKDEYSFASPELNAGYSNDGTYGLYEYAIANTNAKMEFTFRSVIDVCMCSNAEPTAEEMDSYIRTLPPLVLSRIAIDMFDNNAEALGIKMTRKEFVKTFYQTATANLDLIKAK